MPLIIEFNNGGSVIDFSKSLEIELNDGHSDIT